MSSKLKIVLSILVWAVIATYAVFAMNYCSQRTSEITCKGLRIIVKDSAQRSFMTPVIVRNILVSAQMKITGEPIQSLNTIAVEREIAKRAYVKNVAVFTSIDGYLNIEIEQRTPVVRIEGGGYRFYMSDDNYVLPVQNYYYEDVPIVTGITSLPFSNDFAGEVKMFNKKEKKVNENYQFLYNLINFVRFIDSDTFWRSQIVQINIDQDGSIELIPRVGESVVSIGNLDDYNKKLDKLFRFYRNGLSFEGWNKYKHINVEYADQVVCTQ